MKRAGIAAFAFGTPQEIPSNELIGEITIRKAWELDAPVYTQLDVPIEDPKVNVTYTEETPGEPPPTLRIARGAVRWAIEEELDEIWIVAAAPHMSRCVRDMKSAIKEAKAKIQIYHIEEVRNYSAKEWFTPLSTQPRTQSARSWWPREWILRVMPMFVYKRVAS